jgi:hypothetical protein
MLYQLRYLGPQGYNNNQQIHEVVDDFGIMKSAVLHRSFG